MQSLLGTDTRGDFANGAMQDIHWSQGLFGFFPSYLLGALIAAQLVEAFEAQQGSLPDPMSVDDVARLGAWLCDNIWTQGARRNFDETVCAVTGAPLTPGPFLRQLEKRYLEAN